MLVRTHQCILLARAVVHQREVAQSQIVLKKSNPSGKNTDAKNSSSSSYPSFFPWWGTSNHKEKNDVDQIKKEIKALNKSDQKKIKKYVDDLVK